MQHPVQRSSQLYSIVESITSNPAHLALTALLLIYIALAVAYSLASPIYEPTDELRHFRYVRHIAVHRHLPVMRQGTPRAQSHHPPLYYALGALVSSWVPIERDVYYKPATNPFWAYREWEVGVDNKNQYLHGPAEAFPFQGMTLGVYLVRWMTVLIGAGTVWLTYRVGRELFPDEPALALGGAAIVAFNPQFLHLSSAVNNDILAALWGTAILLICIRLVRCGPSVRTDVTLGVLFGLALLSKLNLAVLAAPIGLAYALATWRTREWHAMLRGGLIVLGVAALIAGWWFARNQILYDDPTGMRAVNELWAGRSPDESWWAVRQGWTHLWSSLWGRFGYGQVPMPRPIYQGILGFCLLALGGYLVPRRDTPLRLELLPAVGALLTTAAVVVYYILIQPAGAMGRFLFPGLSALALLLITGLSRFVPSRLHWTVSSTVAVGMAALAMYALIGVLIPAFAPPRPLSDVQLQAIPNQTEITFGDTARLLGYEVTPKTAQPGDTVEVTLYWQAMARAERDYAVFVHLLSEVGTMVAQRDTHPGLGRYPTTAWTPGVAFADTYRVHIPETAYAPDTGHVQVGLYQPNGPRLTTSDGRDAVRLARVKIRSNADQYPNPVSVNFSNKIELIGYTLEPRAAQPGDTIHLTLYWRALAPMENDYKVFAHILGVDNQIWGGSDSLLIDDGERTSAWEPGHVVKETRELEVGLTTPADFYDIEIGLYKPGDRLKVLGENGHKKGNRLLLVKLQVER